MDQSLPYILADYLDYMRSIRGNSESTIKEYTYDLSNFLKFMRIRKDRLTGVALSDVDISAVDESFMNKIILQDLYAYISYADKYRDNHGYAKFRKVASLKSFFKYLFEKVKLIDENPAYSLEYPKTDKRLPIYLTLDDAAKLLNTVSSEKNEFLRYRDYAIMMIFLNCGLRLSELTSINIDSIKEDRSLNIIGKGNKERTVFLNDATYEAVSQYLERRPNIEESDDSSDGKALFLSNRNTRISNRAVQHMIEKRVRLAGLDPSSYTVHKLRHTAATLMYKYGDVDIRALQEILGHVSVATTQIYTHIDTERIRSATDKNPLSQFEPNHSLENGDD
ncbi:MAG: tyrosine recombinase XerC [Tissierellia bacterium]|nr:tyrosine recombinase XerC [Tissierellia bacterium]